MPPSPGTLQQIAQLSGGRFYRARTSAALDQVYKKLATRIGHKHGEPADHRPLRRRRDRAAARAAAASRRSGSGGPCREARCSSSPPLAAVCAVAAAPAGATNECRGLQVCVPVAGPWVLAAPGEVQFQLACPKTLHRRRARRRALEPRHRRRVRRQPRQPGQPGHHDLEAKRCSSAASCAGATARRASARTSAACRRPAAASACRRRYHAVRARPAGRAARLPGRRPRRQDAPLRRPLPRANERLAAATHAIAFYGDAPPTAGARTRRVA